MYFDFDYNFYKKALQRGEREVNRARKDGKSAHIVCLAKIEPDYLIFPRVDLGEFEIPIYLIKGCIDKSRALDFSASFYPLADEESEFSTKWMKLYEYQLTEGISDPIVCYEYLGYFYVENGNKRVSVLSSLGALSIHARVTRILPRKSDSSESLHYREFLDFFTTAEVYGLYFSSCGGYKIIQKYLKQDENSPWPDVLKVNFRRRLFEFHEAITTFDTSDFCLYDGDILLLWLKINSIEEFLCGTKSFFVQTLQRMWNEVAALGHRETPLVLDDIKEPEVVQKLASIVAPATKPLNIAFIYHKSESDCVWTFTHDLGRKWLEESLGDSISVRTYFGCPFGRGADEVLHRAIKDGSELIFTTAPTLLPATLRMAIKYPKVGFYNCSIDKPYVNIRTYDSRIYEAKFISGAIAGAMTKNNLIGYVAPYPILGVPAAINAFALGAAMTNMHSRIVLRWSCLEGDYIKEFVSSGIEYVSNRDSTFFEDSIFPQGLSQILSDGSLKPIAFPEYRWGNTYVKIVEDVLKVVPRIKDQKPVNYWWGMDKDAIDIFISSEVPENIRILAELLKTSIKQGTLDIFRQHLCSQDKKLLHDGSRSLSYDEILNMDYLLDRVEGTIPAYKDVREADRATVRLMGLKNQYIEPEMDEL